MAENSSGSHRRDFLRSAAAISGGALARTTEVQVVAAQRDEPEASSVLQFPRSFTGAALQQISFPLGGVGAGSIGLGGRGQLRDWEICNRADKGRSPDYAFASIWAKAENQPAVARVLESRIQPPYEGQNGLGSHNAPGLARLSGATFTGEFPLCRIDFHDGDLPVTVSLEAGTPFIPLDPDHSGLPMAAFHYRVRNTSATRVEAAIAFSVDNPVAELNAKNHQPDTRQNELRRGDNGLQGVFMHNPGLDQRDPGFGSFVLAAQVAEKLQFSVLRGWPAERWWTSALLFWDDFSADGQLGPEPEKSGTVGSVCLKRAFAPGEEAVYTFYLAWHFPNRTPERCGWTAPKGHEHDIIGNWYATRFPDSWAVAVDAAANGALLEERTKSFAAAFRESTLPFAVKEAASANLSTLVTQTCFRTADGEFHGFEGTNDQLGCCAGNCTHVWNYETATAYLFPSLSKSLRRAAFGFSMDQRGAIYFRQTLPDGIERIGFAAADGQMGQIIKVYLDWQLSGDDAFLNEFWPKAKRALQFCWISGGWDANRDGVMEGVQHNTYDVEFYGPNPLCSIYYLGALRAAEEMAKASNDAAFSAECRRLFESGSKWIDANLFNGEYYIQQVRPVKASEVAPGLIGGMGAANTEKPEYQVGNGCLIDQLLGQYLADVCGLGTLVDQRHIGAALRSIHTYNHKRNLSLHNNVQRTFALNDEAAMVICDYGKGERPRIPFPYYAEVMTGFEHAAAALMIYQGMVDEGVQSIADIRGRYDGVRRNPWNEAECGNHYARAMAAWTSFVALSGFRYAGPEQHVIATPRWRRATFKSFWSTGSGWGSYTLTAKTFSLQVTEGTMNLRSMEFSSPRVAAQASVRWENKPVQAKAEVKSGNILVTLAQPVAVNAGQTIEVEL